MVLRRYEVRFLEALYLVMNNCLKLYRNRGVEHCFESMKHINKIINCVNSILNFETDEGLYSDNDKDNGNE